MIAKLPHTYELSGPETGALPLPTLLRALRDYTEAVFGAQGIIRPESPSESVMPLLRRMKGLGYYYQIHEAPAAGGKVCRLLRQEGPEYFESRGATADEAVLRSCLRALIWESGRLKEAS